jgi:phage anti-repressor protein
MNEISTPTIPVTHSLIGDAEVQSVNARELHAFLESKIRFNDWIRQRIEQYGFKEGDDYARFELDAGMKMTEAGGDLGGLDNAQKNVALESMGYKSFGQQGRIEYAITLDMAKELSMVERNDKGKQARRYFIECERRLFAGGRSRAARRDPLDAQQHVISVTSRIARSLASAARALGLDKNAAAISANNAARKITGVDTLALLGHTHLVAEDQTHMYFTPTELGQRIGVSGRRFNQLLLEAGLQECHGGVWIPAESKAKGLYRILDTGKRYSDGTMVPQLKWSDVVLSRVSAHGNVVAFPDAIV